MQNDISKFKILKKELPKLKTNVSLKNYTTFRIGGVAKYFFVAKTKKDLLRAILAIKKYNLPFFILGGGSNLLVSDKGFNGLVIKMQNTKYKIQDTEIMAEAGVSLGKLVSESLQIGAAGLEWAIGIPGTIGGAIRGNAGAFDESIADITKTVTVLEIPNPKSQILNSKFKTKILKNKDCKFDYRGSIFKYNPNLIIISAVLELKKGNKKEIKEKMKKYLDYRKKNHPLSFPSAGSVFKNKKLKIKNKKLLKEFPELKKFNQAELIPAGFLIEKCGLKGKRIGNVKISKKHTNFIVNLGQGQAEDVKKLISLAKQKVKNKFRLKLEEEIQYLP